MEFSSVGEYKEAFINRNFNNVVDLLVTVGRCKRKLDSSNVADIKAEKARMWEQRIRKKYEVLVEEAGVRLTGFDAKKGSYFYEADLKKHKIYQVTSISYFWTLGLGGKRELPGEVAFDLAENHLPFAVLSVTGGNAIDLMARANLKATEILARDLR